MATVSGEPALRVNGTDYAGTDELCVPLTGEADRHERRAARGGGCSLAALAAVSFLINCQPSEPFLSQYLVEDKNLTTAQLDSRVWPVDTYGAFLFMLPAGVLAESIGYRRVILLGLLCREATRLLLLFGEGVPAMAFMQLTYAAATCVNTVYWAYVYMALPPSCFGRGTAVVMSAWHGGNVLGSLVGQVRRYGRLSVARSPPSQSNDTGVALWSLAWRSDFGQLPVR